MRTQTWSGWTRLESDDEPAESDAPGVRGNTDPIWVGPSTGVQVRASADDAPTAKLPNGLRLDLIDPGRDPGEGSNSEGGVQLEPASYVMSDPTPTAEPTDTPTATAEPTPTQSPEHTPSPTQTVEPTDPADTTSPSPTPTITPTATPTTTPAPTPTSTIPPAPPSTVPRPPITLRAGWGADETLATEDSIYLPDNEVKAVVVHHTAGTNSYSCAESASIIRAIYTYDVRARGYRDIGYNFLIDKCGTIFEGRKGGIDKPVYGAHARGWNNQTSGVSVLGNLNTATPSTAVLTSISRLAAWKLGQYGADPDGTTTMIAGDSNLHSYSFRYFTEGESYTFPRIVGHRDLNATECPGTNLYAKLPTIRKWAAGPVQGLKVTSVSGAGLSGSTYYTKGGITVGWTTSTPSSLIAKFDILVDGTVAATASRSARSAQLTVPSGTHNVQVRGIHQSTRKATTTGLATVTDTTAPTFTTQPRLALRKGTVNTSAVPVALGWKATDNTKLKNVRLTSPTSLTFAPSTTSWNLTTKAGTTRTWSMTATDYAANTRTNSISRTPVILQESAATRTGTWKAKYSSNYLGGKSYTSATKGSSLTWTFTGRSAAWIVSRASGSGQAYVYVDGTRVATVDLRSTTVKYRQAIWTKTWTSSAKHKVKIVVVGTSGRPTITTDGLTYLK